MANTVTAVIFLSLLFAVSHARFPLDPTANDITVKDPNPLPDSDPKTGGLILLPSEKPESEPSTIVEREAETTAKHETSDSNESDSATVPLTVISFHPISSNFLRRPLLPFRHRHNCRHGNRLLKPWAGPRFHHREVPFGNDMILAGEDRLAFDRPLRRGGDGERQVPARWVPQLHHGGPRFPFKHDDDDNEDDMEEMIKRPHHHPHPHNYYPRHVEGQEMEREEHEHENEHDHHRHYHHYDDHDHEDGGFASKIRKFLNQF